jgi:molecular chaperone DnaK (HSP70)
MQSRNEHKTPSIVIYDRNFNLLYWGREAFERIQNGEVEKDEIVMEKFKLNLPSSVTQKGATYQTGSSTKTDLLNMRATIDYFREIYDHTVSTIQREFEFIQELKIEKEDIRFVITVPAQWNDVQRAIMRNIAKEAGLISDQDHENRLLVIDESLAAALYCERKYIKRCILMKRTI